MLGRSALGERNIAAHRNSRRTAAFSNDNRDRMVRGENKVPVPYSRPRVHRTNKNCADDDNDCETNAGKNM